MHSKHIWRKKEAYQHEETNPFSSDGAALTAELPTAAFADNWYLENGDIMVNGSCRDAAYIYSGKICDLDPLFLTEGAK